ncbi:hypothetical protein NST02_04020 [Robertmurraya sp. FSL W8-0741]|uniref:hypothetical protein n=1 Tax=Robertmurraya TaxID=2837507 RepID=UPI0010F93184|nr:hypothetical protein [Robertmurraya siralis]
MKLTILDQIYMFDNETNVTEKIIEKINSIISEKNLFFSHLIIDGQEVYEDHEEYMLAKIEDVKEIEAIVKTVQELIDDVLITLDDYTSRAIPEIKRLVNEFYQIPSENTWLSLTYLLDGIDWLYQSLKKIDQIKHSIVNWGKFVKSIAVFEVELPNLMEAIENKDSILIADIIQYEILPQFEIINGETKKNFAVK